MRTASSACAHVRRVGVGVAVHGHRAVAQRARRAHHAAGDLAAVGDQDLREAHCGVQFALALLQEGGRAFDAFGPQRGAREHLGGFLRSARPAAVQTRLGDQRLGGAPPRRGAHLQDLVQHALPAPRRARRRRAPRAPARSPAPPARRCARPSPPGAWPARCPGARREGRDLRRHHAERRLGQAERGALAGDRHVGHAGQAEATAHHRAFEHRHQRQRRARKGDAQLAELRVDLGDRVRVRRRASCARLAMSLRSAPAQKCPPAPRSTSTRTVPSASAAASASRSSSTMRSDIALRTSGRFSVTCSTAPSRARRGRSDRRALSAHLRHLAAACLRACR